MKFARGLLGQLKIMILLLPFGNKKDYYDNDTGFNRNMEELVSMF